MATHATGTFEVKLAPQTPDQGGEAVPARLTMAKQFQGDLEGVSRGQMLSAMGGVQGSAGYVAMERVSGSLHGREGSFVLQHTGTMNRGKPELSVTVVPDSGTAGLEGLEGRMTIQIADGKHSYEFDYTLTPG